jgi:hypothetical protein
LCLSIGAAGLGVEDDASVADLPDDQAIVDFYIRVWHVWLCNHRHVPLRQRIGDADTIRHEISRYPWLLRWSQHIFLPFGAHIQVE